MKKLFIFGSMLLFLFETTLAQNSQKTNLSLQVSAAAEANRAALAGYVWTRTVTVFEGGELKLTTVSSLSVGADGKMITTVVSSKPAKEPKSGIFGDKDRKKLKDLQSYVDEAVTEAQGYIYMSKGKMVDFFDKATITPTGNNFKVTGTNVNKTGDTLTMTITKKNLAYISKSFKSSLANNDPVSGSVNYKTFTNGLTAIDNGNLILPAKKIKLHLINSAYAKKMN
ncbi:MAG TPA: hypothetical protein VGI38_03485 [Puia sp.]